MHRFFLLPFLASLSLDLQAAPSVPDASVADPVEAALVRAGDNAAELRAALEKADPSQVDGLRFLIAHMPERDLTSLKADYLLENLTLAYQARAEVPWGTALDDELFFNDVLPYASINERRDNWRKDFHERFLPLVKDCKTPGEAAQVLNREMWNIVDVRYHATKRPKPDQSPYESMEAKFASCSGLSVLLIDACRAVSVPARFVGTPMWSDGRGNHSWVEVWDNGWKFTGACEFDPAGLDRGWFAGKAAKAEKDKPANGIYATSWKAGDTRFPLVWNLRDQSVHAVNVTDRYTGATEKPDPRQVFVQVFRKRGGERIAVDVEVFHGDRLIAKGRTRDTTNDSNDMLAIPLEPGKEYVLKVASEDFAKAFTPSGKEDEAVTFHLEGE
jgi:hypothetical protein